ncbi:unnamed protein product, partial [Polarella glacialis]
QDGPRCAGRLTKIIRLTLLTLPTYSDLAVCAGTGISWCLLSGTFCRRIGQESEPNPTRCTAGSNSTGRQYAHAAV